MLKARLIPILLLKNGRMVKPIEFGMKGERDVGSPTSTARIYNSQDADELVFLDITASGTGRKFLLDTLYGVAENCFMPLAAGGGIRTVEDAREIFKAGADKVSVNTAALERPAFIRELSEIFGSQSVLVSIDVRRKDDGSYEVYGDRGTKASGRKLLDWAKKATSLGAGEILLTSIDREGSMKGYDIDMVRAVAGAVSIPVIANGGAGTRQDCVVAIEAGATGAGASSLFHFSDSNLTQVKSFMWNAGLSMRPI